MKKFLLFIFAMFVNGIAIADTINLRFVNEDNTTYQNSTCTIGSDLNVPSTNPTKRGYNFIGWAVPKYTPLEYIENVPGETYINTGVTANAETELIADFMPITAPSANNGCPVFGVFKSNYETHQAMIRSGHPQSSDQFNFVFFGGRYESWRQARVRHTIAINKNGYSNNENFTAWGTGTSPFQASPLYVFANKSNDISTCTTRIYSLQIYQNDVLVHDYVPALDLDGEAGLYDKIDRNFLYNSGTGAFVAGPVIDYD